MNRTRIGQASLMAGLLVQALAWGQPAAVGRSPSAGLRFTSGPAAERAGGGLKIRFSLSAAADVEVAVLDGKGQVVRHLAAGVIGGPGTPPAPLKPGLAQELTWDGKDDLGVVCLADQSKASPFKVRVRAGARAALEKFIGWNGNTLGGAIVGLAVDERGELYVLDHDARMKVFGRDGRYLRTIMPYPADTPKERLESIGQLEVDGQRVPVVYSLHPTASPDGACITHPLTSSLIKHRMTFGPGGCLVMASGLGSYIEHGPPRHLLALDRGGGAPPGMGFVGPRIRDPVNFLGGAGERGAPWFDHLASSPDGQWIYLVQAGESRSFKRQHGVFRLKWTDEKLGPLFVGREEAGEDDAHFNDPQGVATDKAGNLFVCDRLNNRVAVFDAAGKRLGQFAVDAPEQIAIHPAGDIFIVSRHKEPGKRPAPETTLRRFSSWGRGQPKETTSLAAKTIELIAVDPTSQPARLWAAVSTGWGRPMELRPVTEGGAGLELGPAINNLAGLEFPCDLAADPARNRILVRQRDRVFLSRWMVQVDLDSGRLSEFLKQSVSGPVFALDRQGNIYVAADYNRDGVSRFDPDGKPLPFESLGSNQITWGTRNPHWPRGIAVGQDGSIYVLRIITRHIAGQLDVYGPDGKLRQAELVKGLDRSSCGLGIDAAGNIYLGVNVKPKDQPIPPAFANLVPARVWWFWYAGRAHLWPDRPAPWCYTYYNPYLYHWGSIVKFGSAGGAFYGLRPQPAKPPADPSELDPLAFADKAPAQADPRVYQTGCLEQEVRIVGAQWVRQGYGAVATQFCRWGDPGCCCGMSGFAVDPFGRVYYPNPFRFTVEVVDTAGNELMRIGRYGNPDPGRPGTGPGGPAGPEDIALARPMSVSLAGERVYVSDSINQRIVVVRVSYAVEELLEPK